MNLEPTRSQEYEPGDLAYVGTHKHICCFYRTTAELERLWVPFIFQGLKLRQKCIVIVGDDYTVDEAASALTTAGLDLARHFSDSSLVIANSDGFPTSADVEPEDVIAFWTHRLEAACNEGFEAVRAAVQMTWLSNGQRERDLVPHYEFLGNNLFAHLPLSALCLYDRDIFSQCQLERVAAAHPYVANGTGSAQRPTVIGATEFLVQRALESSLTHQRAELSEAEYQTATESLYKRNYQQAEALFRKAVELEHGLTKVSAMLGLIHSLRGQTRNAEADELEEQATDLLLNRK